MHLTSYLTRTSGKIGNRRKVLLQQKTNNTEQLITDFRPLWCYTIHINSVLVFLHQVDVGNDTDVSHIHSVYIFRI